LQRPLVAVYLTVLIVPIRMYRAIARIALGPDEHQEFLSILVLVHCAGELAGRFSWLPVDFQNDIPRLNASVIGWATRANILDQDAKRLHLNQLTALAPDEFPAPFCPSLILSAIAVSQAGVGSR